MKNVWESKKRRIAGNYSLLRYVSNNFHNNEDLPHVLHTAGSLSIIFSLAVHVYELFKMYTKYIIIIITSYILFIFTNFMNTKVTKQVTSLSYEDNSMPLNGKTSFSYSHISSILHYLLISLWLTYPWMGNSTFPIKRKCYVMKISVQNGYKNKQRNCKYTSRKGVQLSSAERAETYGTNLTNIFHIIKVANWAF